MQHRSNLSVQTYEGHPITFDFGDGRRMVNLTQMSKPFGKLPKDFLKTSQTQAFMEELHRSENLPNDEIVKILQGGKGKGKTLALQGTWGHELLAMKFAGWLSPAFELWTMRTIMELMTTGNVALPQLADPQDELRSQLRQLMTEAGKKKRIYKSLDKAGINSTYLKAWLDGKRPLDAERLRIVQQRVNWLRQLYDSQLTLASSPALLEMFEEQTPLEWYVELTTLIEKSSRYRTKEVLDLLRSIAFDVNKAHSTAQLKGGASW